MTVQFPFPSAPEPPAAKRDDGNTHPGYHPRVAGWLAVASLGIALVVVIIFVMLAPGVAWEYLIYLFGCSLSVMILTFSVFVFWWQVRMVNKPLRDLEKEHKREVDSLKLELAKLSISKVENKINFVDVEKGQLLALLGWQALTWELMTYPKPKDTPHLTREYAEQFLGIPQRAYRKLNAVFVAMQIKTENAWPTHPDLLPLLDYQKVTWDIDGRGAWVGTRHVIFPKEWDN